MSRSGYSDGCEQWDLIRWRGAVSSAIRGRRGQVFLKEMLAALDAMPEKRLVAGALVFDGRPEFLRPDPHEDIIVGGDRLITGKGNAVAVGEVCALGAVGLARNLDMSALNPDDPETVAGTFGISAAMAREIVYINDEDGWNPETPEQRFKRVRTWVANKIRPEPEPAA